MKNKGLTHKLHADKAPFDRHLAMRFGDDLSDDHANVVNQFTGFAQYVVALERDDDEEVKATAAGWWAAKILPRLQAELRCAVNEQDGRFFRTLAALVEARRTPPVDPVGEWIDRVLFRIVNDAKGTRTIQSYACETSAGLHAMFRKSTFGKRCKISLDQFTKTLRRHGVRWSKRSGGRPIKKTPTIKVRHSRSH